MRACARRLRRRAGCGSCRPATTSSSTSTRSSASSPATVRLALLFLDDLVFDDASRGDRALRAALEGGVEARPANVLVWATSNRLEPDADLPHAERADAVDPGEDRGEKIALANRFGRRVRFEVRGEDAYLEIVRHLLAARLGDVPEGERSSRCSSRAPARADPARRPPVRGRLPADVSASAAEELKREAAERAIADEVRSGMAIGLGTGSTARYVTEAVGRLLADGTLRNVVAVPTSEATAALARRVGVPLAGLDEQPSLAVCIDGADEIAPGLALVKGLGGALLREKVVASAAGAALHRRRRLEGRRAPRRARAAAGRGDRLRGARLPPRPRAARLRAGAPARRGRRAVHDDEGNRILDCRFGPIEDPLALGAAIHGVPGVVEHGLFVGMADVAYVAGEAGVEVLRA